MIFSSKDKTPKNDMNYMPEDTDITDKFKYRQNATMSIPFPTMPNFGNRPNLKTAKALLRVYNIPYPLATRIVKNKTKNDLNAEDSKKQDEIVEQNGDASVMTPPSNQLFKELLLVDTLHDLTNYDPLKIYEIFKRELGKTKISRELKASFLASNQSFTEDCVKYIKSQYPISIITSEIDIKCNRRNDLELQKRLYGILSCGGAGLHWQGTLVPQRPCNFVLDSIIAGVHENSDLFVGSIGLLGCAFILVLVANLKRLGMIHDKIINIYDGIFMKLDGAYMKRFIILFLKSVKQLSGVDMVTFMPYEGTLKPVHFNKYFPDHQVEILMLNDIDRAIRINGNTYPINNDKLNENNDNKSITFPLTKREFAKHITDKKNKDNQDLWYLNFLRDAYKADVAVENNYIYMTHDHLAFLYYKMIGGTTGFLLAVNKVNREIVYTVSY